MNWSHDLTVTWYKLNKRPMGHIAHLRKQFKSTNTYDIITLIKRRKKTLLTSWEFIGSSFEQTWIPFTQGCFVPSLVEIGPVVPVVLEKKMKMWKVYRQTDGRTDRQIDAGRQVIRKAHLSFQLRWAKNNSSLSPKSFSESMIIRTILSWQIYVQKYPKAVGGWEKRRRNLCRNCFNLHDTNHWYPSNIASYPWQINVQLIHVESSIKYLKVSIHFQNSKLSLKFLNNRNKASHAKFDFRFFSKCVNICRFRLHNTQIVNHIINM